MIGIIRDISLLFSSYTGCAQHSSRILRLSFSKSQLAAFALAAVEQCVLYLIYFIAYMAVLTYAPTDKIESYVSIAHFAIAIVSPIGSLGRSTFTALNVFSILCRGREVASYPGEITLYGGPILYLVVQAFLLLGLLVWLDGGPAFTLFKRKSKAEDEEEKPHIADDGISKELSRMTSSNDGLRVLHVTKKFGKSVAVDDVTFGVCRGEVFALLGEWGGKDNNH